MRPKEKYLINDITSVDYQAIDSLQKVGQVIQELLRLKHQENQPFTTSTWLYNWNNLDMECKNKKYSLLMCNEFNFFLYFKDKEYFEKVVRPSITAKKEKTLIDYFLLEEYNKFDRFKHVSVYDSLNALEQCLLIAVINTTDPETARMLADQFVNRAKLVETKAAKKNQKFDTVLLMKILESDEAEDDEEEATEEKKKVKKDRKVKRQRSMSASSNSSMEEMNWAKKQRYDSDDEDYGEGDECEGEGGGGGDYDYDDMEVEGEFNYNQNNYEEELIGYSDDDSEGSLPRSGRDMNRQRNVRMPPMARQMKLEKQYSTCMVFEKNEKTLFKEVEQCKEY
jgi:hypothetical protein